MNSSKLILTACMLAAASTAAERWAADHPDIWRVHRLKTVNGFDVVEYPWWLAF